MDPKRADIGLVTQQRKKYRKQARANSLAVNPLKVSIITQYINYFCYSMYLRYLSFRVKSPLEKDAFLAS